MSDPTEEGNKTVFRPSPLQGRKTGQTNFPGRTGAGTEPPVPQQPVWSTSAGATPPAPPAEDTRGTTALAPGRGGGVSLPFASPAGERAQGEPAPGRPAAPRAAPVDARVDKRKNADAPARRGAGATVIKVVAAVLVLCLLAFVAARLLRPDLIPPALRLSGAGIHAIAPTVPDLALA